MLGAGGHLPFIPYPRYCLPPAPSLPLGRTLSPAVIPPNPCTSQRACRPGWGGGGCDPPSLAASRAGSSPLLWGGKDGTVANQGPGAGDTGVQFSPSGHMQRMEECFTCAHYPGDSTVAPASTQPRAPPAGSGVQGVAMLAPGSRWEPRRHGQGGSSCLVPHGMAPPAMLPWQGAGWKSYIKQHELIAAGNRVLRVAWGPGRASRVVAVRGGVWCRGSGIGTGATGEFCTSLLGACICALAQVCVCAPVPVCAHACACAFIPA